MECPAGTHSKRQRLSLCTRSAPGVLGAPGRGGGGRWGATPGALMVTSRLSGEPVVLGANAYMSMVVYGCPEVG
jgi:hypothetical protein